MRTEADRETQATVRSWYVTAATLSATVVLLVAIGWQAPHLRIAAVPAAAAGALTWSEGRRRSGRRARSGPVVTWLCVLVITTGVVALYGIVAG